MTKRALEQNVFLVNEKNDHERDKIKRLSKTHWITDYALDIFNTMKEAESRRKPICFMSKQINLRAMQLDLMKYIVRQFKLSRCTLHLSVYYFDCFIDHFNIRVDKLGLVAIVCVHLAGVICDKDMFVPRYSDINRLIKLNYTPFEYKAVERKILNFFHFELMRPTTINFVELLACSFMTREDFAAYTSMIDDHQNEMAIRFPRYKTFEEMISALAQLLIQITDHTINLYRFSNESPSLLAASCIAAVRQISGVPKRWTPYLTELTSYTEDMLIKCTDILTIYHHYYTAAHGNLWPPNTPVPKAVTEIRTSQSQYGCSPDSGFGDASAFQLLDAATTKYNVSCEQVRQTTKRARAMPKFDLDYELLPAKRYKPGE